MGATENKDLKYVELFRFGISRIVIKYHTPQTSWDTFYIKEILWTVVGKLDPSQMDITDF